MAKAANPPKQRTRRAARKASPPALGQDERSMYKAQVAFSKAASDRQSTERKLGAASAGLSGVVALAIFGSLSTSPNIWVKIGAGVLSALATLLLTLDKFLKQESAADLQKYAGQFANLRYRVRAANKLSPELGDEIAKLEGEMPSIPTKYWDAAEKHVADKGF